MSRGPVPRKGELPLVQDWYLTVFELIDMRSFSNLWFWIALAVMWSTASHYVLGVPFDMVARARKAEAGTADAMEAVSDLHDLVRVNVNRLLYIERFAGQWLLGLGSFVMTTLAIVGFGYGLEFAQAVFLLGFPMSIVFWLSLRTARKIHTADGEGLEKLLTTHRRYVQSLGIVSIFFTSLWGMWQNMNVGVI
ncbi:MAG: component of SufBCD complex [Pseudomonadota bacterium]